MVMQLRLLCVVFLLCYVIAQHALSSDDDQAAEKYWKAKLPNVRMPQAIKNNLLLWNGEESIKGGAVLYSNMGNVDDIIGSKELKQISKDKTKHEEKLSLRAWLVISHGGVFVEKNLAVGLKVKHEFHNMENAPFMPKKMAKPMPFSKDHFTDILDRLSIDVDSLEASSVNKTLNLCSDIPLVDDENRTCIQSLEGMVDYVREELGTNKVKVFMMNPKDTNFPDRRQEYVVAKVKKLYVAGNYAIGCHKLSYPYAVYLCHRQHDIGQYSVTLVNSVTKVAIDSTVICHNDLYAPDVSALRDLGIQPGEGPICHLYVLDDIIWVQA